MKTIISIIFILTLNANVIKAQIITSESRSGPIDYRVPIIKLIGELSNTDSLMATPTNHMYVFTISLSFNAAGKVDTVYFSDPMSENLKKIINTDQDLTSAFNSIEFTKEFANKLVILPIVFRRIEDWRIINTDEFLSGFVKLWPKLKVEDKLKPVVFLKPVINRYSLPTHHNKL